MVFQSYALWPHMSAFQNVAYPLRSQKDPRLGKAEIARQVVEALSLVGIVDLAGQYPNQMSGGQQQRVALARALVGGSRLVLFDEPLSNVDAKVREQLRVEMLAMQRQLGFAAIYVTHDQAEAMLLADQIAVIQSGSILQLGSPRDVYYRPRSREVAHFVGTSNEVAGRLQTAGPSGAVVDTLIGKVAANLGSDALAVGDDVVALWRPERCVLTRDEPSAQNRWRGIVKASSFAGSHTITVVAVGEQLFWQWSGEESVLAVGEHVWVSVSTENVLALRDARRGPNLSEGVGL
jgi:iron(III) transport system ATP-binding protein